MKTTFSIVCLILLLVSCGKEASITNAEALRAEAFKSPEFVEMQSAFDRYYAYKSKIRDIKNDGENGKISKVQYETQKEAYIQECASLFKLVVEKTAIFNKNHQGVSSKMTPKEILDVMRNNTVLTPALNEN